MLVLSLLAGATAAAAQTPPQDVNPTCVATLHIGDFRLCDTGGGALYLQNGAGTGGGFVFDVYGSNFRPFPHKSQNLTWWPWLMVQEIDLYGQLYLEGGLCEPGEYPQAACSQINFGPTTKGHPNIQTPLYRRLEFIDASRPVRRYLSLDAIDPNAPVLELGGPIIPIQLPGLITPARAYLCVDAGRMVASATPCVP